MHWLPNLICQNNIMIPLKRIAIVQLNTAKKHKISLIVSNLHSVNTLAVVVKTILILYLINLEPIFLKYVKVCLSNYGNKDIGNELIGMSKKCQNRYNFWAELSWLQSIKINYSYFRKAEVNWTWYFNDV